MADIVRKRVCCVFVCWLHTMSQLQAVIPCYCRVVVHRMAVGILSQWSRKDPALPRVVLGGRISLSLVDGWGWDRLIN